MAVEGHIRLKSSIAFSADMNIPLRERDLDIGLPERLENRC
jgi:hypothetical protein